MKGTSVIQSVPLATEPGISLIILTPMKKRRGFLKCLPRTALPFIYFSVYSISIKHSPEEENVTQFDTVFVNNRPKI